MDQVLNDDSEGEDEQQIKQRLLLEMDQMSLADTIADRSMIQEDNNYDFLDSKIWGDFMVANRQREEMLHKIEEQIQVVKNINQGQAVVEVEDEHGQMVQMPVLNNIIDPQKIQQIKEQVKLINAQQEIKEDFEEIPQIIQIEPPKKFSRFITKQERSVDNQQQRIEFMNQQREIMFMEQEDELSKEMRNQYWEQLFKNRLFTLPNSFAKIAPLQIPKTPIFVMPQINIQTPMIEIPRIPEFNDQNLAPSNTKELVIQRLQQVKFIQLKSISLRTKENQNIAANQLEIKISESEQKCNIVYTDFKKSQSSLNLYNSKKDIRFQKLFQTQQELFNNVQKLQLPKYQSYRQPFVEYENTKINLNCIKQNLNSGQNQFQEYVELNQIDINTRKLEIKLETLQTIEGIELFKNLRLLVLSSNCLQTLTPISSCQHIIELNLSQNQIIHYDQIGLLKNLRQLNLEMNQIKQMSKLSNCNFLEIYKLNGNSIQQINHMENLVFLRQLYLFKNQLSQIQGLENNICLELIDFGSNKIEFKPSENPFKNQQSLRKLLLYKNKIQQLPDLRLFNLQELNVNKNRIESLNGLIYLPSLQSLLVQDNQLQACYDIDEQIGYHPNLYTLDISGNKIQSFGTISSFIAHSQNLNEIDYSENPFLFQLNDEVLQLYRYLLVLNCQNLSKVNKEQLQKVDLEYLKEKFSGFFQPPVKELNKNQIEDQLKHQSEQLLKNHSDMIKLNALESRRFTKNSPFCYTERYKLIQISNDYLFLKNNFKQAYNIQQEIDNYLAIYNKSICLINSFIIKWIYKHKRMKKYYQKNITKLIKVQAFTKGKLIRNMPMIKVFRNQRKKNQLNKFAILIQKVYRGYRLRKKMKNMFSNIKFEDPEMDEMNDFNDDFLNQDIDMNFDLRIPNGLDLQQIFKQNQIQQQFSMKQQQQQQQQAMIQEKVRQQMQQQQPKSEKQMRNSNMSASKLNSQMQMSKYSEKTNKTDNLPTLYSQQKVDVNSIMQNWNFKDPQVALTIACKLEKDKKRKIKTKELTATEKLQRFRNLAHKN